MTNLCLGQSEKFEERVKRKHGQFVIVYKSCGDTPRPFRPYCSTPNPLKNWSKQRAESSMINFSIICRKAPLKWCSAKDIIQETNVSNWEAFIEAVHNDDVATVQRMRCEFPHVRLGWAVLVACQDNSVGVVAELLHNPSEDILVYAHQALDKAAQYGHTEVLKILLPHTDPKHNDSNALLWAVYKNHQQCVDVLFEVSDVDVVWRIANERRVHMDHDGFDYFEQRMMARAQHAKLTEEVEHAGGMRGARKL